ncbi:hypothetical protein C7271_17705, partial [filamentous cyanobacterium CCP5]
MVVDYDLVVLGGTLEAREAAWLAARTGARVALVASPTDWANGLKPTLVAEVIRAALLQSTDRLPCQLPTGPDWTYLRQRLALAETIAYPQLSRQALQEQGIDVVIAIAQFSPRPRLAVTTDDRRLTARAYLIACGGHPRIPAIPGLESGPWLTPATLLDAETQPQQVIVLGRGGDAVATAQLLAARGSQVALVTRGDRLLPDQDRELAQFATALLKASRVEIHLATPIEGIQSLPAVSLTTPNTTLKADQLILATGLVPNLA